jgi:hypothetical protein
VILSVMFVISESSRDADASRGETKKKKKNRATRASAIVFVLVDVGVRDPRAFTVFVFARNPTTSPSLLARVVPS